MLLEEIGDSERSHRQAPAARLQLLAGQPQQLRACLPDKRSCPK